MASKRNCSPSVHTDMAAITSKNYFLISILSNIWTLPCYDTDWPFGTPEKVPEKPYPELLSSTNLNIKEHGGTFSKTSRMWENMLYICLSNPSIYCPSLKLSFPSIHLSITFDVFLYFVPLSAADSSPIPEGRVASVDNITSSLKRSSLFGTARRAKVSGAVFIFHR